MLFKVKDFIKETNEFNDLISTPLGDIKLDFHFNQQIVENKLTSYQLTDNCTLNRYENDLYEMERLVNVLKLPLDVERSIGIIYRFKLKQPIDRITFQTSFIKSNDVKVYDGQNHGDDLYALKWHNNSHHLHIGTQDLEALQERIMLNDFLPIKLQNLLHPFYEDANGLSIRLQQLDVGKIGQIQFVISWSKDIQASWYGVDLFTKEILPENVEY